MKISKNSKKIVATVTKDDIDKEFDAFGEDSELEDDFPSVNPESPTSEYLTLFNKAIDNVQSAIQSLVKSSSVSKDVSEAAQKAAKESVKNLAVVLAELQLAKTDVQPTK